MGYQYFKYETLNKFCNDVFVKFGFNKEDSKIISDVLLLSDLYGIESHGMQRMVRYHKGIEKGLIDVNAKWDIVFETPVSCVIDANFGMGQVVGHFAMEKAIQKAKESGIAVVTVRNSNHYGIAGYYSKMACKEGLIGISMTNSEAIMVPTNCRLAMLGSNPLAIAMPAEPVDFFFDASTTVVTRGKLEVYNKKGQELPKGWALNAKGQDSSDSTDVLKNILAKNGGGILPLGGSSELLGGHKGYGYGMLVEIFTSIISMGRTSNVINTEGKSGTCHGFIVINPDIFGDRQAIKEKLSGFLQELREAPKAEGSPRIYTHGEKEIEATEKMLKDGIPVNENTLVELKDVCDYLNIEMKDYFGDIEMSSGNNFESLSL